MPTGSGKRYDFFLSRRGSVAAVAGEVENALGEKGYRVLTQDYDIPLGASFIEKMHEAVSNSRDLVILFTHDYLDSPYTRKEFTSFEAERAQSLEERHIIVLRCEDVPLRGLLADYVYQDLVGVVDSEERRRRIVAAAERQSQARPPLPRPFIGVPRRIASFTGRADELDRLDAILMRDQAAAVTQVSVGRTAVQGMGGVGKTSVAIEYAHRYRNLYAGVCWCPAEVLMGLLSGLATLAVTLGAATAEETDVEKAAKAALRRLGEQRATWLLVYDNVPEPKDIAEFLPSAGARVLITSRFSDWSELADELELDVLPVGHAVALLERRTRRSDAVGAEALADALGRLPLALDHAAAYCKRTGMRFADYMTKASGLLSAAPRSAGYPRSVAATFDLAITEAVAQCQAAEALMAFLAQCAPERIPMALVERAFEGEAQYMKALATLVEVSLVRHDPFEDGTPAVTVHRLVQAVTRARSEINDSAREAVARMLIGLVNTFSTELYSPHSWAVNAQLIPHLLACCKHHSGGWQEVPDVVLTFGRLLLAAGNYFRSRALYARATPLAQDALEMHEKMLGPEHPETLLCLSNLADLLQYQGNLARARPLCERALAIRERVCGVDHPDTAESLNNLAHLLQAQGEPHRARPLYERALAICEKVHGPWGEITAACLNNLGKLHRDLGDPTGAYPLFKRALAIREKAHGSEHPMTALSLNNLAFVLKDQGDLAGARPLFERALAIRQRVCGPEHPDTAQAFNNLAHLLQAQGDLAGARSLFERALAIRQHHREAGPE
jgi:tetratricopeptide (TPR) repeat protein